MTENMRKFVELAQEDETLTRQVESCTSTGELLELAKVHGIELNSQDFRSVPENGALDDEELENVAGGSSIKNVLKVFQYGKKLLFG